LNWRTNWPSEMCVFNIVQSSNVTVMRVSRDICLIRRYCPSESRAFGVFFVFHRLAGVPESNLITQRLRVKIQ